MGERIREKFKLSSAVFVLMFDGDKVLLQLRSNTGWFDGQYSLPSGIIDGNEPLHLAAVREAKEEMGVEIMPTDVHLVHLMHNLTVGEEWTAAFFITSKWEGTPEIREPDKHGELKWVSVTDLPKNTSPDVKQAIRNYLNGVPYSLFGWEISDTSSQDDYLAYYGDDQLK
ncbi:MAG: 8-oxo-dGTP diphosphatase [Patescibacteria group bacterium]|jgi:8-oxo-dGTP pyrophosphatase MutT (NUDIX family)|nr:8-oxo-dGTP diphosphatase [Patescibacteria group bacterium]